MGGPHVTDALLLRAPSPGSPAGGDQCVDGKDRPEGGWGAHAASFSGEQRAGVRPCRRAPRTGTPRAAPRQCAPAEAATSPEPRGSVRILIGREGILFCSLGRGGGAPCSLARLLIRASARPSQTTGPRACVLGPPGPSRRGGSNRAPTAMGLARDEAGAGGQAPESGGGNGNAENSCRNRRERQ